MEKPETKFLHIVPPECYLMSKFIRMTLWDFERKQHTVLCNTRARYPGNEILLYGNVTDWDSLPAKRSKKAGAVARLAKQADVILFHGFVPTVGWLLYLYTHPAIRKTAALVALERDTYYKTWVKGKHKKQLRKVLGRMASICLNSFGAYITAAEPIAELMNRRRHIDKHFAIAPYEFYEHVFDTADAWREKEYDRPELRVWISGYVSSGSPWLEDLMRFTGENMRIYAQEDQRETDDASFSLTGFPLLENSFRFQKTLTEERMIKLISALDIGIFDRYQRTNTLYIMMFLYMGKKVFISDKDPWYEFLKSKNLDVYTIESIADMDYETFSAPAAHPEAGLWVKEYYSHEHVVEAWKAAFDYLAETISGKR